MKSIKERIEKKTVKSENGCLLWQGSKNTQGYGQLSTRFKQPPILAHRAYYEIMVGMIPAGKKLLHKCDNPLCIEPEHMFIGTQKENMQDKQKKNRAGVRLTKDQVIEIRSSKLTVKELSFIYNVTCESINNVLSRRTWNHL